MSVKCDFGSLLNGGIIMNDSNRTYAAAAYEKTTTVLVAPFIKIEPDSDYNGQNVMSDSAIMWDMVMPQQVSNLKYEQTECSVPADMSTYIHK